MSGLHGSVDLEVIIIKIIAEAMGIFMTMGKGSVGLDNAKDKVMKRSTNKAKRMGKVLGSPLFF